MSTECLGFIYISNQQNQTIRNQIKTFLNIYLSSSSNSILYFHNSSLSQFTCTHDLPQLTEMTEKITADPSSTISFLARFTKILCKLNKISNINQRILVISEHSSTNSIHEEIIAMSHKIISIAHFCAQSKIICDCISIGNSNPNALFQLASVTGGYWRNLAETNHLLNILTCCIGINGSVRQEIIPVKSELVKLASCSYCNCHLKNISLGYLCPVCMALYCSFVPVCKYCKSKFEFIR